MRVHLFSAILVLACACCGQKQINSTDAATSSESNELTEMPEMADTGPQVLVYRTKDDHTDHVPVLLSVDGSTIVSYPAPSDLRAESGPPIPTELGKGYLLDNRGIGLNVAFLNMDHAAYAALDKAPSIEELMGMITDKDPLLELYTCGPRTRFTDIAAELSTIIKNDALATRCKKLK
ncbi:MAG: hypothetical protein WAR83_11525 [Flavobacteriales bacterium]|nr:hypothetical protein [Flavobacteriales bacterium]